MPLGACLAGQAFSNATGAPLYAALAGVVVSEAGASLEARSAASIVAMQQMAHATGLKMPSGDFGITRDDLDWLADDAVVQTRMLGNNRRTLTRADAHVIDTGYGPVPVRGITGAGVGRAGSAAQRLFEAGKRQGGGMANRERGALRDPLRRR